MIAVTGGAGAMGCRLVSLLRRKGLDVRAIGLPGDPGAERIRALGTEFVASDVRDRDALREAFAGADAVVHLAAAILSRKDPTVFESVNHLGTRNALDAARDVGIRRFVHVSSISVEYSRSNAYSRSKRDAEDAVRASGLDWTILRPALAWGDPSAIEHETFARAVRKLPVLPLPRGGRALKSPVHVDDLAAAFVASLDSTESVGKILALAGSRRLSLADMSREIRRSADLAPGIVLPVPVRLARAAAAWHSAIWRLFGATPRFDEQTFTGLVEDAAPDIAPARELLGWSPRPYSPEGPIA